MKRFNTLTPSLVALLATGSLCAGDVTIGGWVDTWVTYSDDDASEDASIDFAAFADLQFSYEIGSDVRADLHINADESGAAMETGTVTWAINDTTSIMMGQYINFLGWEAAHAPDRYRFDRSILVYDGNFYGAATNQGVGLLMTPSEGLSVNLFLQDMVYGEASSKTSDELAFVGDVSKSIDGFGSVNVEMTYDQGNAPLFGGDAEEDVFAISANVTIDSVEQWTFGGEVFFLDFDAAASLGIMAMGSYAMNDTTSITGMVAYLEPNDDVDDDEGTEVTFAVLTAPTGDWNFALNYELSFISYDANDLFLGSVEMLATIP